MIADTSHSENVFEHILGETFFDHGSSKTYSGDRRWRVGYFLETEDLSDSAYSIFWATSHEQALEYAREERDIFLKINRPELRMGTLECLIAIVRDDEGYVCWDWRWDQEGSDIPLHYRLRF
tara:strand:- start:1978 stop:2343 length:366 start_codon:yes stop_codon:yes gene_type:complete